ncbi:MAG: radical SAM/SPASM domain-containing protein [Bacteroidota bacterium]
MIFRRNTYRPVSPSVVAGFNQHRTENQRELLCHAPFHSLRFSQSGHALACCFNRGHVLGKIPEQNLHEIWFGNRMESLRKYIKHNDLTLGCNECLKRIEDGLFDLSGAAQYDYLAQESAGKYPDMLDFEISNTCNLECIMCLGENSSAIRSNRENLPPYDQHYDSRFVEQLVEFIPYLKEARFSGGEPFLVSLYYDIWEKLIALNPSVKLSVLTNATLLTGRIKKILSEGNFVISVSVDSLNKEKYEKIRRNADFCSVMSNLEYFYDYSLLKKNIFSLNVCPVPHNWDEIAEMVRYCNEKNMQLILHSVIFPPSESLWAKDSGELQQILMKLENEKIEAQTITAEKNFSAFRQFIKQISVWAENAVIREKTKDELAGKTEKELCEYLAKHLSQSVNDAACRIFLILQNLGFNESERKKALINLLSFSPDLILSELMHNEPDKVQMRLKMFNY